MSFIAYQTKKEGLAVGLSWSVLTSEADSSKNLRAKVRKQAALLGATRHVINVLPVASYLGLYTRPVMAGQKPPKRIYSLAMSFLQAFKSFELTAVNAILLMNIDNDPQRCAMVVIEGGQIIHDRLEKTVDAVTKLNEYRAQMHVRYSVFSDDPELSEGQTVTWEQMLDYRGKATELVAIPKNTVLLLGLTVIAIAAISYGTYYQTVVLPAKTRAALLAKQAAQNHTPQYLQKLNAELMRVGWTKNDLSKKLSNLAEQRSYTKGWLLDNITCDFDTQNCVYKFIRLGGEVAELIAIESDKKFDNVSSTMDLAIFNKAIKTEVKSLTLDGLPKYETAIVELQTHFQRIKNSGSTINTTAAVPWPTDGVDMSKVDKKVVINKSAFETKTPFILADSVLRELPDYLVLRSFSLSVSIGADKANLLTLTLKGHSYAK